MQTACPNKLSKNNCSPKNLTFSTKVATNSSNRKSNSNRKSTSMSINHQGKENQFLPIKKDSALTRNNAINNSQNGQMHQVPSLASLLKQTESNSQLAISKTLRGQSSSLHAKSQTAISDLHNNS